MSMDTSNSIAGPSKHAFIGARISQGPWRGTIRFIGQIPGSKSNDEQQPYWLGIEWDDLKRGKHDGIHEGRRYFTCKKPNSGSFIKSNSTKISFGNSFLQALRNKYITDEQNTTQKDGEQQKNSKQYTRRNLADIEIEAPNLEGVRKRNAQLDRLREVGLGGWRLEVEPESKEFKDVDTEKESYEEVARAFDFDVGEKTGDIQNTCPAIKWLDLSRSLIPSWNELAKITTELKQLETLLLHFNRLERVTESSHESLQEAFQSLKDLRLDGTTIDWTEMCELTKYMPMLESLQMGSNELKQLEFSTSSEKIELIFLNLKQLNLTNNEINDWTNLMNALDVCQTLERLILSDNKLQVIPSAPSSSSFNKSVNERKILHITLNNNPISTWKDLENLFDWCPNLQSLSISVESCPFLTSIDQSDNVRPLLIARLPKLKKLNNATISEIERKDAELFYLSKVDKEIRKNNEECDHPRVGELRKKYGQSVDQNVNSTKATGQNSTTLRSKLLSIRIHSSTEPPSNKPPYFKSLDETKEGTPVELLTTIPIRLLKGKLAKILKLSGGMKSIESIWALLSPQIDPSFIVAVQIRSEMRSDDNQIDQEDRIIYPLENMEWSLQQYNITKEDELIVVVNQ